MSDQLRKYLFSDHGARVQTIQLRDTWQAIRQQRQLPPAAEQLLGELLAASVLLAGNLKFDGTLVLQMQGDGPVRLAVVECRADLTVRATIKLNDELSCPAPGASVAALVGRTGQFSVVLDPAHRQPGTPPYQGIVPLMGETVAHALEHYMVASEQLQTRLWLAADEQVAAGMLLQRLPHTGGIAAQQGTDEEREEDWSRVQHLADTVAAGELLTLSPETLIHRLYWEETLRLTEPQAVRFECGCSRDKVANMLRMLGREEVESILTEQEQVSVQCDYCQTSYVFDPVDCAELFISDAPESLRHHSPDQH